MHTKGQIGRTLRVAKPCLWPEYLCGHPCVAVCKQLKPKVSSLTEHPTTKWSRPPCYTNQEPQSWYSPGLSSCKVAMATTRSIGRGERVTEAEWEACGWHLTGSLAPGQDPFPYGEGLSGLGVHRHPHPSGWGTGVHSGSLKPSSCSSGCFSAEH